MPKILFENSWLGKIWSVKEEILRSTCVAMGTGFIDLKKIINLLGCLFCTVYSQSENGQMLQVWQKMDWKWLF